MREDFPRGDFYWLARRLLNINPTIQDAKKSKIQADFSRLGHEACCL